jgi:cell division protein FtsL
MRLTPRAAILAFVVVLGAVFAVAPARGYLEQRAELRDLQRQTDALERQNAQLERQIAALNDPRSLERLARECLGMVNPGEIAFVPVAKGPAGTAPAPPDCG